MQEPYFIRVAKQTPTEFWINNPTREQTDLAIANGATGCTNNPSYSQKMVDHPTEGPYALKLLDEAIKESPSDDEAIAIFQRKLVKPISDKFMPIFKKSNGQQGYVSIQGDPIREDDPEVVIREALENRKLAPNICCKIPTTHSGLQAMEYLVSKEVPLNATEIFGIKQAIVLCETYQKASQKTGKHPKLFISHIAGIYDDHLKNVVEREKIEISPGRALAGRPGRGPQAVHHDERTRPARHLHRRRGARPAPLHRDGGRRGVLYDQLGRNRRQADRAKPAGGLPPVQPGAAEGHR